MDKKPQRPEGYSQALVYYDKDGGLVMLGPSDKKPDGVVAYSVRVLRSDNECKKVQLS